MNINNTSNSYVSVSCDDGTFYQVPPFQSMKIPDPTGMPQRPKLSLKDTTFLYRITAHDPEAKEVISKMLPYFLMEV